MSRKIWEETINATAISAGGTVWESGTPYRIRARGPDEIVQVYFRVYVVDRDSQNLEITCRAETSLSYPSPSAFGATDYGWRGGPVGGVVTVTADATAIRQLEKEFVAAGYIRPQLKIKNTGAASATPTIQVEAWIEE